MKKFLILTCLVMAISFNAAKAQYWTSGGEIIFSWADYRDSASTRITGPPRFTMFLHLNYNYHLDLGKHLGLATGLSMKNVGFITTDETFTIPGSTGGPITYDKIKRRSYTLGIPLMLKIGNMKKDKFLALGAEYDLLFHFKEKAFINGNKLKRKGFMSNETELFIPSVFVGLKLWKFGMIKFQYYLDDFLNKDFTTKAGEKPYAGTTSQMMYVSWTGYLRMKKVDKSKLKKKKKSDPEYSANTTLLKNIKIGY